MKIKQQFGALIAFVCAIPILCSLVVIIHRYIRSGDRYLVDGYKEIRKFDSYYFSKKDVDTLKEIMRMLPPDVEATVLNEDGIAILSSISDFNTGEVYTYEKLWNKIKETSSVYFYQFTRLNLENNKTILITRILREKKKLKNPLIVPALFIVFIILISILLLIILFISKNIFTSIIKIEEKTENLSKGNLNIQVLPEKEKLSLNEITSILNSLEKMRLSLLEAQERKNKLIMGISHDLRTPVAIIKGYTEAINDGIIVEENEIKNSLQLIKINTNQLEDMINTLINYMKLNLSDLGESFSYDSITELIKTFSHEAEIIAKVFKRKIICSLNIDRNIIIPMNQLLAQRAFQNLFQNALRYTKDNDTIELIAFIKDSNIIFQIKDSGIGISPEDLKNIFDLFYRGTNSRREEGMGIGLSVVKNIIDSHNWEIKVESKINLGSTFTITIPFTEEN